MNTITVQTHGNERNLCSFNLFLGSIENDNEVPKVVIDVKRTSTLSGKVNLSEKLTDLISLVTKIDVKYYK